MEKKEIIINKNNKKKSKSKKSSSKEKNLQPFVTTNTISSSIIVSENNKKNEIDNKKELTIKTKKEENIKEIIKTFDPFPSLMADILDYDKIEKSNKSPSKDRIALSVNKLSKGDDIDILNELMSLSDFLSLSNDRIGYNLNMPKLLEEICKNLAKTYLPEIIIYSLQCINYILDINPTLSYVLKKVNAISSIMKTISSVEDITCIDYIIKIFDKISMQNGRLLLENNVFESFLVNIFDFLNIHQKKSLIKICYNITSRRVNFNDYNIYIKPAMNILINLINIEDDDNNEHLFIVEKATNIFYNIINFNKNGYSLCSKEKKEENILTEIITRYNIIENFIKILNKYFMKNNQIITELLIRNILRSIVLILEMSKEGMNKILSNNFLEIIADVVNNEFNIEIKANNNIIINKRKNSNINNRRGILFLPEFFEILIALFPSWKCDDGKNKKILDSENKKYYDFFCQNIFLPLVNNITSKSTNKILIILIKLILAFINNTNKNDIILYLPSKPISQIIIKLLDSKNNSYVIDAISLIKSLLEKAPEEYITNFVREGIVYNLRNFNFEAKRTEKIKSDMMNIDFEKKKKLYCPILATLKGREVILPKENKENDKIKDKFKNENNIISKKEKKKEEKNIKFEFLDLDEKSNNKESEYYNNIKNKFEKEKNSEEQFINIKNLNSNIKKDKINLSANNFFSPCNDSFNEEYEFKLPSEQINDEDDQGQEQDQEEEENNNEELENEEKEEEEEEEQEENIFPKKNSIYINSSYSEEKDEYNNNNTKKLNDIEKDDKKYKFSFNPFIKAQTIKEIHSKNINLFNEESSNSLSENKDDIIMKEELDNKEEINSEKKGAIIKIEEKNKNDSKIEISKDLARKKRLKDFIEYKMKYKEYSQLEDNLYNIEIKAIEEKIKGLLENYLTDEKITKYLSFTENQTKDNLIKIQKNLSNYQLLLASNKDKKIKSKYIKEIIDILTDEKISITLFELENSKILLSLCNYLEPEFNNQYNKLVNDSENAEIYKIMSNLLDKNLIPETINYNHNIFEIISNFLENFKGDKMKIIRFIKLLNESIQGMNCPIFFMNDIRRNVLSGITSFQRSHTTFKLKMDYDEQIFKRDILNEKIYIESNYKTKLCEINMFFRTNQKMILLINENTTFKNMGINLLSIANIPLIPNDKYDIDIKFYINDEKKIQLSKKDSSKMEIEENKELNFLEEQNYEKINNNNTNYLQEEKESLDIDEKLTYKLFIEKYSQKYNNSISPIFRYGLSLKLKNNEPYNSTSNIIKKGKEKKAYDFLSNYLSFDSNSINIKRQINFDKLSFIKDYHNNVIYNKSLYFSKNLMPSLYLLSILNLCINKYNELFNLPKIWFINNDITKKDWKKLFYNLKIEQFILRISLDPNKVSKTSLPLLGEYIINNNQNLTRFQTRLLSFKTSFSSSYKSLINLQNHLKHNNPNYYSRAITLKKTMRLKINVERERILEHGFNIINDEIISKFKGYLEFEYNGEIGYGLGPTLEFYTLIIDKIKEEKIWYKTTDNSLYPKLLNDEENNKDILQLFKLLGYMIGRAIYDDRLLDIPLSRVFWNLVLDRPFLFKSIKLIDSNLYKVLKDFLNLINDKKEYIKKNNIVNFDKFNFDDIILYNKCKLSELDIYFNFPGYDNIELKPSGNNILLTMNNIEEYVNLIYNCLFFKGIYKIIKYFKDGFNMNFNIDKLKCFNSSEIEEYICGSEDIKWDRNILFDNLKPAHGYTNQSKTFNDLIKFMSNLDKKQRKQFLIFSTGSSRLPIGGFKSLSPKLTVVKKHCEEGNDPDDYLPTVMTCQNYLKLPEYSNYDILERKLLFAMNEGLNEFNLS